ncbi:hypothetical protein KIK02_11745 [Leptodesmis sichuanensis A121]|nr:hypothetical protein KIK02_11745 [Leptodesmis sichuanensis A121]
MNLSGLRSQGELNVEVVDRDDTSKLEQWFEERWDDRFCLDISEQLAEIICPKNLEKCGRVTSIAMACGAEWCRLAK